MQFSGGQRDKGQAIGRIVGVGLMGVGLLLLLGVGAFFIYSWRADSGLKDLEYAPTPTPAPTMAAPLVVPPTGEASIQFSPEVIAAQRMFPGEAVPSPYWLSPLEAEAGYAAVNPEVSEFSPVPVAAAPRHSLPVPVRISIPAIELDSEVISLQIVNLDNSLEYETPKNAVGHIPESANAGEDGTAWFFGHLESPIQGEGSVFFRLREIPDLLRQGQVYATVENGEQTYLYRLTTSRVLHEDDLVVFDSGEPSISLVTCVPRFLYDHRLVVEGELVGLKG